jgi:DNA polymerase III epsilon subunit-like protein
MGGVVFVDTETTGLDPDRHEIWEVALIVDGREYVWQLPVDLGRADARALEVGRYHERTDPRTWTPPSAVAEFFARLTRGRHLVGAVVSFDEERLRRLLRAHGACPEWHYHLIDVEALAVGYLHGYEHGRDDSLPVEIGLPWDSEALSREVGVNPDLFDRHTALGDARWAKAIYEAVIGVGDG